VVHDLQTFLTERMREMNKEKQQEIKGFLGWREGFVGARVEDLTPKTRLQSYYEHDYDGFLAVLMKNRKKLAVDGHRPPRAPPAPSGSSPPPRPSWRGRSPPGSPWSSGVIGPSGQPLAWLDRASISSTRAAYEYASSVTLRNIFNFK